MVLHSKNGQTELGSIEYIGADIVVNEDAYYKESGKRLTGKSHFVWDNIQRRLNIMEPGAAGICFTCLRM